MTPAFDSRYTTFEGGRRISAGSLQANALAARRAIGDGATKPVLIFEDETGRVIDIDMQAPAENEAARLPEGAESAVADEPRGRGRPKLGVVAREVTLLPRHWEWLATQPGGASVALRKLVEEARRANGDQDRTRKAHQRAYRFMSAIAGDLPGFEEATRALFADDAPRFAEQIGAWPCDVRDYATRLAFGDGQQARTKK
ncbi:MULTISPECIES: DUF2239 family protein [unclassified Caballeronia]|uniref:DUF2239 family protein n=1 Tax=unclassified Caballeronia TaxID=2646786 RepID=UPI002866025C|nr:MULTISPECIES: DUF2239 family protein [unclassified Caballeronia]MDR5754443.1 DUF2239 family protein [Caballeronia sp. LZ024]MDR5840821.1 DUF2239 family protein [Caballeronia sp. LZ031]